MRSSSLSLRLALAAALLSSGAAMAQSGGGTGSAIGDEYSGGHVQSVDVEQRNVVLDDGRQLKLRPNTEIVRDGIHTSLSDVQPGDEVRASYQGGGVDEGPIAELDARSPDHATPVKVPPK